MKGTSKNSPPVPRELQSGEMQRQICFEYHPREGKLNLEYSHHRYRCIHSKLPRTPPVTGAAYIGTLQNRTCFKGETGWLRNIICPSLRGADFFYVKNALTHETYFLFQAVDLKPKHYLCFLKTAEFTTDESALHFEKQQQKFLRGVESMKIYKKIMNALAAAEKIVLVISTLLILVLTVGNVFSRKVIHRSWSFTEELVVAVFVLITLLAAALACREGELVSLTLVTDRLPKKLKKPSVILITVLSIIFSVILFKYGMDKVITQLQNGKRTFVLNWPEWIFWSFVPIGAGCMILHFIEFCLDFCCKTDSAESTDNSTKSNINTITTDKKEGK